MEKEKYFIPEISDLFVGYECEKEHGEFDDNMQKIYVPYKMEFEYGWLEIPERYNERLRTPYLTKEQIENEGWSFIQQIGNTLFFKKKDFELTFNDNYININNFGEYDLGYWGQCKDINAFRYLMKLLEI